MKLLGLITSMTLGTYEPERLVGCSYRAGFSFGYRNYSL